MKTAFVFPGQGSQAKGMLGDLARRYQTIEATFKEASLVLGYDLWQLTQEDLENKLNQTEYAQPALLAAEVALWRVSVEVGQETEPSLLAGHSLGEYAALICADALRFSDGLKLVQERGRLMQQAVPAGVGAMAALLGLHEEAVAEACAEASTATEKVSPANYNSPGQVVISGHATAVTRAIELAKAKGAKRALSLAVSVPSHCPLMQPAALKLKVLLEKTEIKPPRIPILYNVDAKIHQDVQSIRQVLVEQLYHPVQWVATIKAMEIAGITSIIECGPGKVLSGLNKRIVPTLKCEAICL